MILSKISQKLDDILLFQHIPQDDDLSKVLADTISKLENIKRRALKQTSIV